MLRASSSRALARARSLLGTSAGTSAGAATLKPTVPAAPTKPSSASSGSDSACPSTNASRPNSDNARNTSAATISRVRDQRSASMPAGIDSSRNGSVCAVLSAPISPGPALSAITATIGTAARLICSADCAARLVHVSVARALGVVGLGMVCSLLPASSAAMPGPARRIRTSVCAAFKVATHGGNRVPTHRSR